MRYLGEHSRMESPEWWTLVANYKLINHEIPFEIQL